MTDIQYKVVRKLFDGRVEKFFGELLVKQNNLSESKLRDYLNDIKREEFLSVDVVDVKVFPLSVKRA